MWFSYPRCYHIRRSEATGLGYRAAAGRRNSTVIRKKSVASAHEPMFIRLMTDFTELDAIDRRILDLLQADGRRPQAEIAAAVGVAASTVHERIRRLERAGVMRPTVLVDADAVGLPMLAFTLVSVADPAAERDLLRRVKLSPQVIECHHITGEWNYLLKIRAGGSRDLERLLADEIKAHPGVSRTLTMIALSSAKETPVLPTQTIGAPVLRP